MLGKFFCETRLCYRLRCFEEVPEVGHTRNAVRERIQRSFARRSESGGPLSDVVADGCPQKRAVKQTECIQEVCYVLPVPRRRLRRSPESCNDARDQRRSIDGVRFFGVHLKDRHDSLVCQRTFSKEARTVRQANCPAASVQVCIGKAKDATAKNYERLGTAEHDGIERCLLVVFGGVERMDTP